MAIAVESGGQIRETHEFVGLTNFGLKISTSGRSGVKGFNLRALWDSPGVRKRRPGGVYVRGGAPSRDSVGGGVGWGGGVWGWGAGPTYPLWRLVFFGRFA